MLRRGEQAVDDLLVGVGRGVGDEGRDLVGRRRQAGEIVGDAAQQRVAMGFAGADTRRLYAVAEGADAVLPLLATLAPGSRTAADLT